MLFFFIFLFTCSNVHASKQLTEQQALNILAELIKKDKLYNKRFSLECLIFATEKTKENIDVAIHEKHDGKCPGDPNTSPVVDRFRIDRTTKEIEWFDVLNSEFVPYKYYSSFGVGIAEEKSTANLLK